MTHERTMIEGAVLLILNMVSYSVGQIKDGLGIAFTVCSFAYLFWKWRRDLKAEKK